MGFSFLPPKVQAVRSLSPQLNQPKEAPINHHSKYCCSALLLKEEPPDPLGQKGRDISFVSDHM